MAAEAIRTQLQRWCYFFKHGASLDSDHLPATLDVPVIRKAMEVLVKLSQDEIERHRADERLRAQRDAANLAASLKDARQEAIEKGMLIGSIRLLQLLLQQPQTSSRELDRLSEDDLLDMEEALKQQFSGKKQANGPPGTAPAS